jgi:hypothetical protein
MAEDAVWCEPVSEFPALTGINREFAPFWPQLSAVRLEILAEKQQLRLLFPIMLSREFSPPLSAKYGGDQGILTRPSVILSKRRFTRQLRGLRCVAGGEIAPTPDFLP